MNGVAAQGPAKHNSGRARQAFVGFDKNDYPGDDLLPVLRRSFAFTGYWLNSPPGMASNPWSGKRAVLRSSGFGFVILFNGRLYADLKAAALKGQDAAALGRSDAAAAISAADKEGFPALATLYLDQEEGGHLLPEQAAYLFAWIEAVFKSAHHAGVYCSGIPVGSDRATTANDILRHYVGGGEPAERGKHQRTPSPALWVADDQCPPSPGCSIPRRPPLPGYGGIPQAAIWQYAQSPRRAEFTAACAISYSADNACYAPGLQPTPKTAVDLNTASSADPSHGR